MTDPLIAKWAGVYLGTTTDDLKIWLHLHDGQDDDETKRFRSDVTGVPVERFGKTYFKREGTGHRKNRLYRGTAAVRIAHSGAMLHRVLGWIDALANSMHVTTSDPV